MGRSLTLSRGEERSVREEEVAEEKATGGVEEEEREKSKKVCNVFSVSGTREEVEDELSKYEMYGRRG